MMNRLVATPDKDAAYHFDDLECAQWAVERWNRWQHRHRAEIDTSDLSVFRVILDNGRYLTFSTAEPGK